MLAYIETHKALLMLIGSHAYLFAKVAVMTMPPPGNMSTMLMLRTWAYDCMHQFFHIATPEKESPR